ncbi:hypothetical protein ATCCBAA256_02470 [Mycobacterium montefiorense]|nr:hypothetical protein ATCCBAA256_02470 [Mycobacterium montefiorense]
MTATATSTNCERRRSRATQRQTTTRQGTSWFCAKETSTKKLSEAQLHGAALAFAWATQTFHVAAGTLAGHRDLAQTSCPGTNLYAHLSSGDLKHRIDDLLAAGPVNLERICGTDAAATVAAIEAG